MSFAKKNAQAADECDILPLFCDRLLLTFKHEFLDNVLLRQPPGKTPVDSINIDGWQIHPTGPQRAQNKHLCALCKILETVCDSVQVLRAITPFR